jgi:hypothetical protein
VSATPVSVVTVPASAAPADKLPPSPMLFDARLICGEAICGVGCGRVEEGQDGEHEPRPRGGGEADRAGPRQFASTSQRATVDRRDVGFPQRFEAMENALAKCCRFLSADRGLPPFSRLATGRVEQSAWPDFFSEIIP